MRGRRLFLDGISNYIVFTPMVSISTGILAHWQLEQYVFYWLMAIPIALGGGALYGRFLNAWRKRLNYN